MKKDVACAELLGILCGDGCLSRSTVQVKYFVYCSGNKLKDADYFKRYVPYLFYKVFGRHVIAKQRTYENTIYIKFSDKKVFEKLNDFGIQIGIKYYTLHIPSFVLESKERQLAFLRGLFDTDGCVILSKQHRQEPYYPRIEIKSKSHPFLESVMSLLKSHGFTCSISVNAENYRLEVAGFKNLTLWKYLISSSNERNLLQLDHASKSYLNARKARRVYAPVAQPVERARKVC